MDSRFISTPKHEIELPDITDSVITDALPIGTRLLQYVITGVIGQGGFGITYEARENSSGQLVAIKENYPSDPETNLVYRSPQDGMTVVPYPDYKKRFEKSKKTIEEEAQILTKLPRHPHIVRVLTVFKANNTAYIVMELIKGRRSLNDYYPPSTTIPERNLRQFLKDMLGTLAFLHAHHIYHRDIKPDNILITPTGRPVLIDFGAARSDNSRYSSIPVGSDGYAPPEQTSQREYDIPPKPHTDLYSLGATCYRLTTGYKPDYMFERLAKNPAIKKKYSPELLRSIDKAREQKPNKRWQNAQDWLAVLNDTAGYKSRRLGMLLLLLLPLIAIPAAYLYYHQRSEFRLPATKLSAQNNKQEQFKNVVTEVRKRMANNQYDGLVDMLLPLAEQNYAPAQFYLGLCYERGIGVKKAPEQAVYWYRKAAEQNDAKAQFNLGVCYFNGRGVEKDQSLAVQWFRKAAEQNYAKAQYNLGICYYNSYGVDKDYQQAIHWFQKAAVQNDTDAQNILGYCYKYGIGVERNIQLSMFWYSKATEKEYAEAQNKLSDQSAEKPQ